MLFPEDLSVWTYETVADIVTTHELEPGGFDYKEVLNPTDKQNSKAVDDLRHSIRKAACALANTDGGFVIFGVRDRGKRVANAVDRIVGIPAEGDLGAEFGQKVSVIQPNVAFETSPKGIEIPNSDKVLFVVRIPRSRNRPHMIETDGAFYRRDDGGFCVPMRYIQVRELMMHRQEALLANLKWELEEIVSRLVPMEEALPIPIHTELATVRHRQPLKADTIRDSLQSGRKVVRSEAHAMARFWLASPNGDDLPTIALTEAINSGEFLIYDEQLGRLVAGGVYDAIQRLYHSARNYRSVYSYLKTSDSAARLLADAGSQAKHVVIYGELRMWLCALYDRQLDILQLAMALLRHINAPEQGFVVPELRPISPLEGESEKITSHQASHADVERWVNDEHLSKIIQGDKLDDDEAIAAMGRHPALSKLWGGDKLLARHQAELQKRLARDGEEAAFNWLIQIYSTPPTQAETPEEE